MFCLLVACFLLAVCLLFACFCLLVCLFFAYCLLALCLLFVCFLLQKVCSARRSKPPNRLKKVTQKSSKRDPKKGTSKGTVAPRCRGIRHWTWVDKETGSAELNAIEILIGRPTVGAATLKLVAWCLLFCLLTAQALGGHFEALSFLLSYCLAIA